MRIAMVKGPVTLIRTDMAGMKEAQERGFEIVGNCDEDGNIVPGVVQIDPEPSKGEPPKDEDPEKLNVADLKAKLEALKVEIPEGAKKADLVALLKASVQK